MVRRRGFLAGLVAVAAAPWAPKALPSELRGCTYLEWDAASAELFHGSFRVGEVTRTLGRRHGKSALTARMIETQLALGRKVTLAAANPDQMRRYVEDLWPRLSR